MVRKVMNSEDPDTRTVAEVVVASACGADVEQGAAEVPDQKSCPAFIEHLDELAGDLADSELMLAAWRH